MADNGEPKLMTEKHVNAITRNYDKLSENLTVSPKLLSKLVAQNIITMGEEGDFLELKESARGSTLLRLVTKREDKAYYVIIDALKDCKMLALAKLLEDADNGGAAKSAEAAEKATDSPKPAGGNANEGAVGPMTEEHQDLLDEKRMELLNMDPSLTLDKLRALKVFTGREAREIRAANNGAEAEVGEILDRLQKKDDGAFGKLITALRETKQQYLAALLE